MAESSIIREFLVALGFKTDESALKNFDDGIAKATKTVFGLAAAVEGMAATVAIGVAKFASNMEALYFATLKTHSSAENLKALDRAVQNFGGEAGEAVQSIQGLARFLREKPGGEGLLASLGVQTRGVNGQLRDTTDLMLELGQRLGQMPYYLANQYAHIFGLSEDTLRALINGDFAKEMKRQRDIMQDVGFTQATEDAHTFMMMLRDLETYVYAFGMKVYEALSLRLGVSMKDVTEWLRAKGPAVAARIAEVLIKLIDVAERVGSAFMWIVNKLIELDKATGGWSTRLLGLLAVLKFFGGAAVLAGVFKLSGALLQLSGNLLSVSSSGTGALAILSRLGLIGAAGAVGYGVGTLINQALPESWKDKIGKAVSMGLGMLGNRTAQEAVAVNDPLSYLHMSGWTKEQAAGILANLQAESGMNPQAVGDNGKARGLAQWHPDRQAAFAKWAGHDIGQSTTAEQLDFLTYELRRGAERQAGALLAATRSAREAGQVVSRYYERPAAMESEARKRGEMAVHIAQETNIHVGGGDDPRANGRAVRDEQERVNANLVRNLQAAVQ